SRYPWTLELLRHVKRRDPNIHTKSGLMLGLGETEAECDATLRDLAAAGCGMVTVGQYLRPSRRNLPVTRYALAALGRRRGIAEMVCAPLARSSYKAGQAASLAAARCCMRP
ncbi:MAG TPA: lipoyl synthase, partial [Solidesulfovibrio sp.]|nr:lipoyl synthase [Solidesulfovibrio sp.]